MSIKRAFKNKDYRFRVNPLNRHAVTVRKIKTPAVNWDQTGEFIELGVLSLSLGAQRASFPSGLEPPLDKVGGTITGPGAYRPLWML